jgi:hypothetical protein
MTIAAASQLPHPHPVRWLAIVLRAIEMFSATSEGEWKLCRRDRLVFL